jgi:hypothetical protein
MIRSFRTFDEPKPRSQPTKTDGAMSAQLHQIAHRLERLAPNAHDPERYFEQKSEIIRALKILARRPA